MSSSLLLPRHKPSSHVEKELSETEHMRLVIPHSLIKGLFSFSNDLIPSLLKFQALSHEL